jgi:hypothetical protein
MRIQPTLSTTIFGKLKFFKRHWLASPPKPCHLLAQARNNSPAGAVGIPGNRPFVRLAATTTAGAPVL